MKHSRRTYFLKIQLIIVLLFGSIGIAQAQDYRWLTAGSFHNFYSSMGAEIEQGFIQEQQAGWQWPAIYRSQDAQNWQSIWLGVTDFTDEDGNNYPYRVAHVGPRETGLGQIIPMEFETRSKFAPPTVIVDGVESVSKTIVNEVVDETMAADREIYTRVNSILGIQMERTIKQFSQQYHDNYHIIEYVFTNTGNTDADDEIELPDQTITGFVPFFSNRMAPVQATRYVFGNDTGWGRNTMNDRRGDGQHPGEEGEDLRASFAWHGYWQQEVDYDNIGGPIWVPVTSRNYLTADDTTGRLGAYHFVGTATLHADTSPTDDTDDPNQPSTMLEIHSDDDILMGALSAFSIDDMTDQYALMTSGKGSTRHAFQVEPDGLEGFINPSTLPNLGTSGGFSYAFGYGPYTLEPGESVKIVIATASAGISRELAEETGIAFKAGDISAIEKNEIVFQGRDSLFQTFERAIANYNADYGIPEAPNPPRDFYVTSAGNGINLEWAHNGGNIQGFEIYRASGRVDSTYRLLYEAGPSENIIIDGDEVTRSDYPGEFLLETPSRGRDYFYYIVAVGEENTDTAGETPPGSPLISSRYFTQTYDPARLLRPAGEAMEQIRVVPNPYNPNVDQALLLDQEGRDRIAFFEVPGMSTIEIYTELGELVRTIEHTNGSGDEYWDLRTDYRQRVVSGIYIARIINEDPNDDEYGSVAIRKIVIIL